VPAERLSMRKIKEVLRLKFGLGFANRQIARSCSINHSTVADYVYRAKAAGLDHWPLPGDLDEAGLEKRLFPTAAAPRSNQSRVVPDWPAIHEDLRSHKHLTLQLVWQEYKQSNPEGYQYSRFCWLYQQWARKLDLALRQEHRAGEKLFVDYAGDTVSVIDSKTGTTQDASIFVAVLGPSNYTYAEATWNQDLGSWIRAHVRALEFLGGAPALLVPDNCKTAVRRPCRYEPDLNPTYQEMAAHYGMAIIPARVKKPRDKAKVEAGVLLVERWILAALRKRRFFSLAELNQAITELLDRLNHHRFRKLEGNRAERFATIDRPALRPLPVEAYTFAEWKKVRVNIDYHIEIERHYYSVPYTLLHRELDVRYTAMTVEIFHRGQRIASHARSSKVGGHTTNDAHRPKSHQRYLEWTPERLVRWASTVGPFTAALVDKILQSRPHPEQGFRSCLGILRLGRTYGSDRLEAASTRACNLNACSYQSVKSILNTGLDRQLQAELPLDRPPIQHTNIRGTDYFNPQEEPSC
jgi:transposase